MQLISFYNSSNSAKLHWEFALALNQLVFVLLEYFYTILSEIVAIWLGEDLEVVWLKVAEHFHLSFLDDTDIEVWTRAQIMVDTSLNSLWHESNSFILGHAIFVLSLHDTHGLQRPRSRSQERWMLRITIAWDFEKLRSSDVNSAANQMGTNVATVVESMCSQSTNSMLDSVLTVSVESVQFQFALDHLYSKGHRTWLISIKSFAESYWFDRSLSPWTYQWRDHNQLQFQHRSSKYWVRGYESSRSSCLQRLTLQ